jgi:gliding motility-associated-like protein
LKKPRYKSFPYKIVWKTFACHEFLKKIYSMKELIYSSLMKNTSNVMTEHHYLVKKPMQKILCRTFPLGFILLLLVLFLSNNTANAQCGANVPTFTVNLTGSPDSVWQSPPVIREDNCCSTVSPDRCVQFIITLDSAAVAINFEITGGAIPPGSLFYQINCGTQITAGQSVCITGIGPHIVTFCKPGNNNNQYSITSIPHPIFPPGGTVRVGCTQKIEVLGLVENTIAWNSIYPGASGTYNSYLSCTSGCSSPEFTPAGGAPPYIEYRVCGFPKASNCGFNFTVCDTIRVYTSPELTGSVTPNPAGYCPTSAGINLTGSASGGVAPYTYTWKDPGGVTVGTGSSYFATAPGNYTFEITDSLSPGCPTTIISVPVSVADIILTPSQVNVSCNGNFDGEASVSAAGGTAPYAYLWSNTQTSSTITGLPANSYTVTVTDAGGCTASTTINITQPSTLSADITSPVQGGSGTNISCQGQSSGEATANASGGVAPYSYTWNTGATTQTISNLGAGFYEVTVTDQNGCTQTDTLTLTEPDTIVVLIDSVTFNSGSTVQCFGSNNGEVSAIVNGGTAPYVYTWSTGATTATITNQPAGPVSISVEDANGCLAGPVSFIFIQPDSFSTTINSPVYSGGYNISCNGASDGSVDITVSGASPPYTYFWSDGSTTQNISGVPAGNYTVTVTDDNGCTTSMTIDLTEPSAYSLTISSPTNSAGYNIGCNGETNGTATANPAGGTQPYSYLWNTGAVTQTITNLGAGSYDVTVTDDNGCILTDGITLTEPDTVVALISSVTVVGGANASCYGATDASATVSVTGGTLPYVYLWSTGDTTDNITNVGAGTISVLVMDSNGCSDSDSFTITEPDSMQASVSASLYNGGYNVSCNGATDGVANIFVFGGSGTYTYNWSTGGTSDFINVIGAGIYTVTVTDDNGCTLVDSIELIQPDPLTDVMFPFAYPGGNNISCTGASDGSIYIEINGGTEPYSYSWSNGATTDSVFNLPIGSYTVTVTDDNGCTISGTVVLDEPAPISVSSISSPTYPGGWNISCNAGVDGAVNSNATGGSPPYSFYWSNGDSTQNISGVSVSIYIVIVTDINGCTASDSILLTEPELLTSAVIPITSSGGSGVSCAGGTDGGADLTVNGGTAPYDFLWSNGDTTEDLSNVPAGTYYVTITDVNGCSTADTVIITDPTILTATLSSSAYTGGNNISCKGASDGSITLTVGGGSPDYSYLWSNTDTTQNLYGVASGTYIVTVTDVNGCTASDTISLTQPLPVQSTEIAFTYTGGYNVSCNGASDGSIDITPTGGISPYTYLWSTADTIEDISGLTAGSYSVTVTDINGCTGSAMITLTEPDSLLGILTSPTFAGGYNVSCGGSDGSIDLSVTGGNTAYSYLWSNGETTQNIDSLTAGTYTVTITDANGCTFTDNITLTQPGAYSSSISSPVYNGGYNITCNGADNGAIDLTVTGGTSPYVYLWSTGDSIQDLSGLPPGIYTVTVTDDNNCTLTASITLTEPPLLQGLVTSPVNPGGYNINCFGGADGSATATGIDGTPGYSYLWSNGSTSNSINIISIGPHFVTITDSNNCSVTDTITLTEPPVLVISSITSPVYPGGWNISCNGGSDGEVSVTVTGGAPGYFYTWSNGDTTQIITNVSVTGYIATVTDVNGCTATNSITLTEPPLLSSFIIATVTPGGSNISCNGSNDGAVDLTVSGGTPGYTYSWSNGSTLEDPAGLTAGSYSVIITDTNGCTSADTVILTEPAGMNTTTVTSNFNGSGVTCYSACDGNIDLTVSGGATPYTFLWSNNETTEDIGNLCSGSYSVTITDANGCTTTDNGIITEPLPTTVMPMVSDYSSFGVSCNNNCDGYINLSTSGGTQPYTVLWNTGETTDSISTLCAGIYNYTVTDANGCVVSDSITITEPQPFSVTSNITNVTCNSFCDGVVNLTSGGGAAPYIYAWSSGQNTEDISGACAGNYTVTITDANGCSTSASYTVTEPPAIVVNAGTDQNICGASTTLSANNPSSGIGSWSVITGTAVFTNVNDASTSVSGLSPGLSTLEWTINDGPCSASATVNIFADEVGEAIVFPDDTICNDYYTLRAENPLIGYGSWSVSGNSPAYISDPNNPVSPVSGLLPGQNVFIWTVTNGTCSDTARITISIDGAQKCDSLEMPTGISPNGDGYNDEFVVLGLLRYPDNELVVFNRWGNEVYAEKNYANTWKGVNKSGDNLPDGTYFVILKVNNIHRVLKGYLDIRR